ncbi:hypothetical protein LIER_44031 [Lithospermum erythrorhizon]|uniref:Uncharacterized protein n=1 Tax=Lithospermum erythrorhizon TaxID=34254 RepID=A0AAV3RS78_LITER
MSRLYVIGLVNGLVTRLMNRLGSGQNNGLVIRLVKGLGLVKGLPAGRAEMRAVDRTAVEPVDEQAGPAGAWARAGPFAW